MEALPSILIGMPVFEGWEHVGQALDSICSQTFENFRVLISVDGADRRTFAACEKYAADPRFQVVLQPERLHWEGGMNWLVSQLREDYFCYWQHDDYCDADYLRTLVKHARSHPEASVVYCDMQHFGTTNRLFEYPSVTGFALQRVLTQIVQNNAAFIRCLIRADAMRASLPIQLADVWGVVLAREGELHRVPKALYFRRVRPDSLSIKMRSGPPGSLRTPTMEWGLGVLRAALPVVEKDEAERLLVFVADQLINHRPRRNFHFDFKAAGPDASLDFMIEFLREARARLGVVPFEAQLRADDPKLALAGIRARYGEGAVELLMIEAIVSDLAKWRAKR